MCVCVSLHFPTVTQMATVYKGPGVKAISVAWFGLGVLCAVLPEAVMVKPESHGLWKAWIC